MPLKVTWEQALAWRMRRQLLDPIGDLAVEGVVRRLCGVQAQVASTADLAIRVRRVTPEPEEVSDALSDGRVIRTWAMRGTLHLVTPEEGAAFLSLLASGRTWERPNWVSWFGLTPDVLARFRVTVHDALDGTVLTREELVAKVIAEPGLEHLEAGLREGWGTLLKPLAWQGDLCFGPRRGGRATFMRPEDASPQWTGLPDPDAAAAVAMLAFFGAYGPTTIEGFSRWLGAGVVVKRQLRLWFEAFGDRFVEVEVDGERAFVPAELVDQLASTRPTVAVRLVPGFDQYVLGPGTADVHVLSAARRRAVSRQSGWIAPVVIAGGVVAGTWDVDGEALHVSWFSEAGRIPRRALGEEGDRLGETLRRELTLSVVAV